MAGANQGNVANINQHSDYPLANSEATRMLAEALERANEEKGWSQRTIAKMLNYRTSVVLSHMALGRVPIPIDRVPDFVRLLKMDAARFLLAVLEQRHPDIDFQRILGGSKTKAAAKGGRESYVLEELEALAGRPLDDLPPAQINVMREVVADPQAPRRWLGLQELPVIEQIRRSHPEGIDARQRRKFQECLDAL